MPPIASGLERAALTTPPVTDSAAVSEPTPRAPKAPEPPTFDRLSNPMEQTPGSSASGSTRPTAKSREGERLHARSSGSSDAGRIEVLSRASYAVKLTASERLHDKIRDAQALLSHTLPKGDLAAIFELALDLLIAEQKKRRFGMRSPRSSNALTPPSSKAPTLQSSNAQSPKPPSKATAQVQSKRSRYVPVAVRREVAERDELRCAYVDPDGERCAERRFLEFEHRVPHARGGQSNRSGRVLTPVGRKM